MAKPKLSRAEKRAVKKTFLEIAKLNTMLNEEMPECPKIRVTDNTFIEETPDLIARFNAEMRLYVRKLEHDNVN